MPHPTAAEQFKPHNSQRTVVGVAYQNRFALLTQMRADAPVTFVPALHVSAMWQAMSIQAKKPLTF